MGAAAHRILVKAQAKAKIEDSVVPYDLCSEYIFPNYSNTYVYLGEGKIHSLKGKRTSIPNKDERLHFFRLRKDVRKRWHIPELPTVKNKTIKIRKENEVNETADV